ncbi:hypothetical protein [Isachenkonia alkalipeptolytica]|uniref:DUF4352 domain-containing protein n=1 Tax=Isachenkonia alkalipeptolytica TaxID=2565777 RepID=A0AA44BGT7_9CLOT|nr:hypothetical protein [Isachenkonia alkalipeptolytica]NBG89591.1 hypothetical protein [Isachenkonia alkalipeptolytica]
MRRLLLVMLLVLMMIVPGCSESNDHEDATAGEETEDSNEEGESIDEDEPIDEEDEGEAGEFETAVGETVSNESGDFTLINRASDIPTQEDGPIVLNIPQVNTAYAELKGEMVDYLERDSMHYIQIDMEVENTSSETIEFYASQATITTNTGEQLESDFWLSDHIEGTYIGEVRKSGSQFFILENSEAEDIEWVRIIISGPTDEDWETLGEGMDFKVEF